MLSALSSAVQHSAPKAKEHNVAIVAQQLLRTHLFCGSLACGGRQATEPRKDTRPASTGHIRGGVSGGVKAAGPTASV